VMTFEVAEATPQSDSSLAIVPPGMISNEAELLNAVRYFIGVHSEGGRTTPREIARYLGTLKGGGGCATAIEVMRARFHKLRNLIEAFPKLFELHEPSRPSIEGGPEYEISLAAGSQPPQILTSRSPSPLQSPLPLLNNDWQNDEVIHSTDLLSLMLPKMVASAKIPESVEVVLDILGLSQFDAIFKEHEFLPNDLFLVTDGKFLYQNICLILCEFSNGLKIDDFFFCIYLNPSLFLSLSLFFFTTFSFTFFFFFSALC
jgi:hypothetical protein